MAEPIFVFVFVFMFNILFYFVSHTGKLNYLEIKKRLQALEEEFGEEVPPSARAFWRSAEANQDKVVDSDEFFAMLGRLAEKEPSAAAADEAASAEAEAASSGDEPAGTTHSALPTRPLTDAATVGLEATTAAAAIAVAAGDTSAGARVR